MSAGTGTGAGPGRKGFFLFCALALAVLVGGNLLFATVLATRGDRAYCLGCHRRSGPAGMWEVSDRHSAGFACGHCHGVRVPEEGRCGGFSAHPRTVNRSCIGCHTGVVEGRPLQKLVVVRVSAGKGEPTGARTHRWRLEDLMYVWHLRKRICVCTDCHRNVSHERGIEQTGHRPKMAYCGACHYHAAKDDYVRVRPLPELEVIADGGGPAP